MEKRLDSLSGIGSDPEIVKSQIEELRVRNYSWLYHLLPIIDDAE